MHADHKMEPYSPCAYTSATIGAGGEEYTSEGETAVRLTGPEGKDVVAKQWHHTKSTHHADKPVSIRNGAEVSTSVLVKNTH